jgi:hypothetical protein
MKKRSILKNISARDAFEFDNYIDDLSSGWQLKAEHLQARRWKELQKHGV